MRGFRPFSGSPGLRAGSGAADFCMPGTRYHNPDSPPSESVNRARVRDGLLANQGRAAVSWSIGPAGVGGSPAVVRVVGKQGWPGASRSGATRARVCRIKRVSVCPAAGEGSRMPIRVSAGPKAGERTNAGPPSACLPAGKCGGLSPEPRRRFAGKGRLLRVRALCRACPQNEGSPERLPSPSKINP